MRTELDRIHWTASRMNQSMALALVSFCPPNRAVGDALLTRWGEAFPLGIQGFDWAPLAIDEVWVKDFAPLALGTPPHFWFPPRLEGFARRGHGCLHGND